MRKVELSISGVIKARTQYNEDFFKAYIFVNILRSQVKHPIILNYKQQLTSIRKTINYSDYRFRKDFNNAIRQGLLTIEGNHIRIWSKNKDKAFKTSKKNDYRRTSDTKEFIKITLLEYHYKKQYHAIKAQTYKSVKNSESNANYSITCSSRSIAKLFGYKSSASGLKIVNYMVAKNHIQLTKNKVQISKQQFREHLNKGSYNIRYDNNTYYLVLPSTFKMKSNTRRTKYEPYNCLSEQQIITYTEMGYTREQINSLLG